MAKSIKLKNNVYIDSSGVIHNHKKLSDYLNPVKLFDGYENSTVQCMDDISNYQHISIVYSTADGTCNSTGLIPVSNNKQIELLGQSLRDDQSTLCLWLATLLISNDKLIPQTSKWFWINTNRQLGLSDGNYINIMEVWGYKY